MLLLYKYSNRNGGWCQPLAASLRWLEREVDWRVSVRKLFLDCREGLGRSVIESTAVETGVGAAELITKAGGDLDSGSRVKGAAANESVDGGSDEDVVFSCHA